MDKTVRGIRRQTHRWAGRCNQTHRETYRPKDRLTDRLTVKKEMQADTQAGRKM